jgi:geranylgeranyl pyrophosphate synthase
MDALIVAIAATDAIAYTVGLAEEYANRATLALDALRDSPAKQALVILAGFAVGRKH